MRKALARLALTAASLCFASAAVSAPGAPIVLGSVRHPAATTGLNPERDGRSQVLLPNKLELKWRAHVPFGIQELAVAAEGHLVVASPNAELIELDEQGAVLWSRELPGQVTSDVNLLASGSRVVATSRGLLLGFEPSGRMRFSVDPGFARPDDRTLLLPLPDSSLVAGNIRKLVWLEHDGSPRAEANLDDSVEAVWWTGGKVVALGRSANLFTWDGKSPPRSIGNFGADLRSTPLVHRGQLLALTRAGLREKDPQSGQVHSWSSGSEISESSLLTLVGNDEAVWLDAENALNRVRSGGQQEKEPLGAESAGLDPTLPALSDPEGNLALINGFGEVTLIDRNRKVTSDGQVRCVAPVALLPQRTKRLILACASGSIWALGS